MLVLPTTDKEWQELVDAASGAIALESARQYGLVSGGPRVDVVRAEELLRLGRARGITPRPDAAKRFVAECQSAAQAK